MKFLLVNDNKFEVVSEVPQGYFIWNIGPQNMIEGYIPLCEWLNKEDKEDYSINVNTLKAIRVNEGWEEIMAGVGWRNGKDFQEMKEYVGTIKEPYIRKRVEGLIKYLPQINGYEKLTWRK